MSVSLCRGMVGVSPRARQNTQGMQQVIPEEASSPIASPRLLPFLPSHSHSSSSHPALALSSAMPSSSPIPSLPDAVLLLALPDEPALRISARHWGLHRARCFGFCPWLPLCVHYLVSSRPAFPPVVVKWSVCGCVGCESAVVCTREEERGLR